MIIQQIIIENVAGLGAVSLTFDNHYPVYVVQYPQSSPEVVRKSLCTAVQLICSTASNNDQRFAQAYIQLKFMLSLEQGGVLDDHGKSDEASTSRQSRGRVSANQTLVTKFRTVTACRDFRRSDGEMVEFSVNDGPKERYNWTAFHARFFINFDHILPHFHKIQSSADNGARQAGNWLQLLSTELSAETANMRLEDLFERFFQIHTACQPMEDILFKLTTSCLLGETALGVSQKTQICKVLTDVRCIFEYITCLEYTVWFLIPYLGKLVNMADVSTETLDFRNIKTRIQLNSERFNVARTYEWTNGEHQLQDLLLVAFQLAIALHCKFRFLCLRNLDRLATHQSFEMALAASLQKFDGTRSNLQNKNYLQKIIDVCVQTGVTAIIEFPGGLPIAPKRANLVQCQKLADDLMWNVAVTQTRSDSSNLDELVSELCEGN